MAFLETLPSWLQAIAAFTALGLSVWAVRASGAAQRHRDLLELRGLAVAIYPDLCMLPIVVDDVRERLSRIPTITGDQTFPLMVEQTAAIQLPPLMERNIDKLFLLGDVAGPSCIQLVRFLLQYKEAVQRIVAVTIMMDASQKKEALKQIDQHLIFFRAIIEKCEVEVRPIHDAIKDKNE